ncbi:MAG: hypothetical protein MUD08_18860, partial [Cytophagales bacterium]|nr:hypothetical protein [Cytophagales bacterium]
EQGRNHECLFTRKLKDYLSENLPIACGADGWPGSLERYAHKKEISWETVFKQVSLEVLALGENDFEAKKYLRQRIEALLSRVQENGDPWYNKCWTDDWESLCSSKNQWFRGMWTKKEYKVIQSIGKLIKKDQVFEDWRSFRPTKTLLDLKKSFYENKTQ